MERGNLERTGTRYRPEVDGLRALAVLAVMFFHADIGCSGGYVGVDVFFVISGYLITNLILKDLESGRFSLYGFWERRIRRILPALAVVLIATILAGCFILLPKDFNLFGQSLAAQALLVSNVSFWWKTGYFAAGAETNPLLHTWSLAVEEQFYLLFPLLLALLHRASRKLMIGSIAVLGVASFGLSIYGTYTHPSATFYLLPTRAWELLLGAFLAIQLSRQLMSSWKYDLIGWLGLAAIAVSIFGYERETRFPGLAAVLPCGGTALILWTNENKLSSVGKLLAWRPFVFVGLISYSLYLWHWPLLIFARYWMFHQMPIYSRMTILALSAIAAILSWRFVETPFRNRLVLPGKRIFAFAGGVMAGLLFLGVAILNNFVPSFFGKIFPSVAQRAQQWPELMFAPEMSVAAAQRGDFIELGNSGKNQPVNVLVWGDSHALAVLPALDALCRDNSVRGVMAARYATPPLLGACAEPFADAVVEYVRNSKIKDVLIVGHWSLYRGEFGISATRRRLLATIELLRSLGARVLIMKDVPLQRWGGSKVLAAIELFGTEEFGIPLEEHRLTAKRDEPLFENLEAPDVLLLDPSEYLVDQNGICRVVLNEKILYSDNNHLTSEGAMLLRPLFSKAIFEHKDDPPGRK